MTVSSALRALVPLVGGGVSLVLFGVDHSGRAIAVATVMALAWLLDSLHPALVGFIGAFLFRASEAVEFETAFGGFATGLAWLLFGALLLLSAAEKGGLSRAIGKVLPAGVRGSISASSVTVIVVAFGLSWLMPQPLERAAVLILLASALAPSEGNLRALLGAVAGVASVLFETHVGGTASLIVNAASAVALAAGAWVIWRGSAHTDQAPQAAAPFDGAIALIVALTVTLWMTTSQHRFQPELVGLAVGLLCAIVALARRWQGVTADPLAFILAGTALSMTGVLKETGAIEPLVAGAHHLTSSLGLPADLADYWAWTGLRVLMLDAGSASAAWTIPSSAAATTVLALYQAPSLALAMAICGTRTRQVLVLGAAVFAARSVLMLLL